MMDVPNPRSAHRSPVPRGGGLAIVVVTSIAEGIGASGQFGSLQLAGAAVIGGAMVALVGLIDDLRGLSPAVRLGVHVAAAGLFLVAIGASASAPASRGLFDLGVFGWLFGAIAIVWSINLFNFMDGIDGLAATQAIFVAGGAVVLQLVGGMAFGQQMTLLALAGSSVGFLMWNFPKAKIFMGDVGSGFVGFVLAASALLASTHGARNIWAWMILNGLFLADATVTLLVRLVRGERIHQAHSSHVYQRLARQWGSHRPVTLLYCAVNVLWCLPWAVAAVRLPVAGPKLAASALVPVFLAAFIGGAGTHGSTASHTGSSSSKDVVSVRDDV
jgi:Fuc2NAc and GlcNAc transferase